jgi:hypothetical protein
LLCVYFLVIIVMKPLNLILLCIALAGGFIAPDIIRTLQQAGDEIDLDQYCMLSTTACEQSGVSMLLEHDVTRPLMPTKLTVHWPSQTAPRLQAEFEGLEMQMGVAKYPLIKQEDGSYLATLMLPVCTSEKMTWLGSVTDGTATVYPAIRMER